MQWQRDPQGQNWPLRVSVAVVAEAPAGSLAEVLAGQSQALPENAQASN
jgi:hypothetical protein